STPGGCRTVPSGAGGAIPKVQPGAAPRKDALAGVRTARGRVPAPARRGKTRNVQFPRLHAYLHEEEEQRTFHGPAANRLQEDAGEAERGESRAPATYA